MEKKATSVRPAGPGGRGFRDFKKPKNLKGSLRRVMGYLKAYRFQLVLVAILIIVSTAANIAGNYMLRPIINNYILPFVGQQNPDLTELIKLLAAMAIMYTLGAAAIWGYNRIMLSVSVGTLKKLRTDMFTHMQSLPIAYFDKRTHGEIMSCYTNDIDAMRNLLSQSVPEFLSSAIRIVGVFIMMVILSPILTLISIVMLVIMTFVVQALGKRSGKYFKLRQASLGDVNGYTEEMIEGQKVVKVFCHEEEITKSFAKKNEELFVNTVKANTWASILMPIMNNLSHVQYAITAAAGGLIAIAGYMDVGSIASFLQYSRNFSMPITQLSQQMNSVLSALAGAERIFALMDEAPETDDGKVTISDVRIEKDGTLTPCVEHTGEWVWRVPKENGGEELIPVRGDVRFNDVSFGYEEDKKVLKHVSLYAKPGQKIAFVGSTGAGKTTITNLINRFYDVSQGSITYDGIPVKNIKKEALRSSLAMVLQDTHLFTGTVRENIRYGRLDATDEDVVAAAKLANADQFIRHLPNGYDTMLTSDGANLSQGQRQLLSIARAAVADPPVLILDEATSSIDTRTEAHIERGMDELMRGRTVFVIAHRLSTVRNSNAIMVLEHGEVIERGTHDELLEQKGKYYQLYMGMFELN